MYKFSYFTQKANDALNAAIKAAEGFGHNYIGSEHILYGLAEIGEGVAYNVLDSKGITAEEIDSLIGEYIGKGTPTRECLI